MPRKRVASPACIEDFDDDFDDESSSNGSKTNLPVQRNAANARERARMRVLSSAFCRLKTKLPWVPADTKLSKLDTLRLATIYIQQLRTSLSTGKDAYPAPYDSSSIDLNASSASLQPSLVWPFSFQQQQPHQQQPQHPAPQQPYDNGQSATVQHSGVHGECRMQNTNYWYERHFAQSTQFECSSSSSLSPDTDTRRKYFDHTRHIVNNNTIHTPHAEQS